MIFCVGMNCTGCHQITRGTAYNNNLALVVKGIAMRKEISALLGYKSWAHYITAGRMAGSLEAVNEFSDEIYNLALDGAKADLQRLKALKVCAHRHCQQTPTLCCMLFAVSTPCHRVTVPPCQATLLACCTTVTRIRWLVRWYGVCTHAFVRVVVGAAGWQVAALSKETSTEVDPAAVVMESWDTGFYHQELLKQEYGVDNELVRQYFPLDHVITVTLETYQNLLGLTFTEINEFDAWHDEVKLFEVHDSATSARMGHFYMDLHPREGKYGHAAIFHLLKKSGEQTAVDCMLCNLPAPSADGTQPLLLHSNVVTFFHEFGHIMHGLCAEGDGNSTRLAKCPRDFVEAPSQMLENWCWQPKVLQKLSKHHETGEPLPVCTSHAFLLAWSAHAQQNRPTFVSPCRAGWLLWLCESNIRAV